MSEFLEFTILGVALGAAYGILATGLVLTYNTSGYFNFAHGAIAMVGAFGFWEFQAHHVETLLSLALILLVGAPLAGAFAEAVFMRGLRDATPERPILVTLGILVLLFGASNLIWPVTSGRRTVHPLIAGTFPLLGVRIGWQNLVLLVIGIVVMMILRVFFARTRIGVGMRAVVDDPELVGMSGVSAIRMSRAGWIGGFVFAALAGILIAPTLGSTFSVPTMVLLVVNGYAAAAFGRLKNLSMTALGGVALGLVVTYFNGYAPQHLPQSVGTQISAILPMALLFAALIVLPPGRLQASGKLIATKIPEVARRAEALWGGVALIVIGIVIASLMQGTFLAIGLSTLGPIAGTAMAFGIVGLSLVLLMGYGSQVSLCQFSFMAIGAICMGKISGGDSLLGVLGAVAVCMVIGAFVALPAIRLRGVYLALATFAFADAMQYGVFRNIHVFGTSGITVGRLSIFGISMEGDRSELVMLTVVFSVLAYGVLSIRRSRFGRRLVALNDSPAAGATVGLNPSVTKVIVFSVAAGMAGLGGALYASLQGTVSITSFTIFLGLMFVLFLVIWGTRTISGAFLASVSYGIFTTVPHFTKAFGIFAGLGVILIGRATNGILGLEVVSRHIKLPWRTSLTRATDSLGKAVAEPEENLV